SCTVGAELAAGPHALAGLALGREVRAAAPGQTGCLMAGDLVVGWGTIADPSVDACA
ncbi:MAG: bifunctional Fe-S cluster assembly protein NifU/tRNA 2-thiouridine(34) synthase MnmA, partial [Thermoleophilaceae bacterium]|nr:bifunctional Fe-S cluster assembly protein NifU/tRNA 2-thiouridine(34) synthase MnmA [Thermoleophilaceae bacterium]